MIIDVRSKESVYITINGVTYYIDDSTDEQIVELYKGEAMIKYVPDTYAEGGKISVGAEGTLKNRGKVDVRAFDINKGIDKVERGEYTFTVFDEGRIDKMNQNDFEKNFTQTKKGFYAEGGEKQSITKN
jgi:hypothetical protein